MSDVTYREILHERLDDGAIVRLTLNRPERRNPLGPQTIGELCDALERARDEAAVRVVAITGAGKIFSAGGDLAQLGAPPAPLPGEGAPVRPRSLASLLLLLPQIGKPVVAVLNGHALAGGCGLALACHLVIAAEEADLGTPEINVGLWPMMITTSLLRSLPGKKAIELMLLGERLSAREAERLGVINRVVPRAALEDEALVLLRKLATKSPAAMRLGLHALYEAQDLPLPAQIERLERGLFAVLATEDAREGLAAFVEKRTPVWKGR